MDDTRRNNDVWEPTLSSLFEQERPSKSWLWVPALVIMLSFAVTGIVLLVDRLTRSKPAPPYAGADVIEKHYGAQLGKLRELAGLYLDHDGTTSEFFEAYDIFAVDGVVQAAIHPEADQITVIGDHRLSYDSDDKPPRPDAEVGRPVVYMAQDRSCVVYRGKMEAEDGREVWYSLTLRLEALRALSETDEAPATSQDEEGG